MCGYFKCLCVSVDDGFNLLYCDILGNKVTVRAHSGCSEIVSTFTVSLLFRGLYCTNRPSLIHKIKFHICLWMLLTGYKIDLYRPPQQIIYLYIVAEACKTSFNKSFEIMCSSPSQFKLLWNYENLNKGMINKAMCLKDHTRRNYVRKSYRD